MSSKKQKSTLAGVLDLIIVLIILPIYYSFIMDAVSDVGKIRVSGTDINDVMGQEFSSIANVIIMMMLKMFVVYAVLQTIAIIFLKVVKSLKKS